MIRYRTRLSERLVVHRRCGALVGLTLLTAAMVDAQTADTWTQKFPQTSPPARDDHAMAFDSAHGQVVLFAGYGMPDFDDTWVWDGSNWTQKSPASSPSARDSHAMAYDSAHGQVVMFGGANDNSSPMNDTWTWDGTNWTQQSPQNRPSARSRHALAYDSAHGQVVLFGGTDSGKNFLNDTWVWDGSNWMQKSPQNNPPPRLGHRMVYDSAHGQVVLFGGKDTNPFPLNSLNDTWVWDGSNWTQKFPNTDPPARGFFAMAYDSAQNQVVMFSGDGSNDTWTWEGSNWTRQSPQNSPSSRGSDVMAYDSAHDQVVLFGGAGAASHLNDTWVWGSAGPVIAPQVSLGSGTFTVSGNYAGDSPTGPAYVLNPNGFYVKATDGVNTIALSQRRNNDPVGGPDQDLQTMTTFDGSQSSISATITALSFSDPKGGTQQMGIGFLTAGSLQNAATTYNSNLAASLPPPDGNAGIFIEDESDGHLRAYIRVNQAISSPLDLTAAGLANSSAITQTLTVTIVFASGTVSAAINGQPLGHLPVALDLTKVVLFVGGASENASDGPATMTYANVTATNPSTAGPPNLLYAISGNNQTGVMETALNRPLVVGLVDAFRNVVPGAMVSFSATNAVANPSSAQTDAHGQATTQVVLGNAAGAATVTATVNGVPAVTFHLTATANPNLPAVAAVVNGASFVGGGIVAGEIATIFGTNLTTSIGINLTSSLPLPSAFLNVSVLVNDPAAPLFAVDNVNGQQQINFQVPWEVAGKPMATIAVSDNGSAGSAISVPVLTAQPGIFSYNAGGNNFGAILHADFQLADTGHPAVAGETVLIYCTGLGMVNSPPADGVAGNGQTTVATPDVTIGGTKAAVSFSGLAPGFVGLYQINAVVPAGLTTGNQPVVISMGSVSSNSALLPVK